MSHVQFLLESHPHWPAVLEIYHRLVGHGYKAFLAGGCVRDALMGLRAHDLDLATDATPDQVESLFEKTVNVGKSFGVIRVLVEGGDIEVATFRMDGNYKDGRHPEGVAFSSPEEDAQRRDFTVNALFYDLQHQEVIDFVQGQEDLGKRLLRTVGDPRKRFAEDHLRLLRAARFVAQLDFSLEKQTLEAMIEMAPLVRSVSGERLREEMTKMLKAQAVARGLEVMVQSGLMLTLFPFRLRDNLWPFAKASTMDSWQNWALFFRKASAEELQSVLALLRFSNKEQRDIERAWKIWSDPAAFLSMNLGKQLQKMAEPGVYFALAVIRDSREANATSLPGLFQAWEAWGERLPAPLLNGEDVKGKLQGARIGTCLSLAYEAQLERELQDRTEALTWLKKYLERDENG